MLALGTALPGIVCTPLCIHGDRERFRCVSYDNRVLPEDVDPPSQQLSRKPKNLPIPHSANNRAWIVLNKIRNRASPG